MKKWKKNTSQNCKSASKRAPLHVLKEEQRKRNTNRKKNKMRNKRLKNKKRKLNQLLSNMLVFINFVMVYIS